MADWSMLPNDLLLKIARYLKSSTDTTRLRAVCSAWRAAVSRLPFGYLTHNFIDMWDGFFLVKRTVFLLSRPPDPIHESHSNSCGKRKREPDSDFWLIKIESNLSGLCRLFNPISGGVINMAGTINLLNFRVRKLHEEYVPAEISDASFGYTKSRNEKFLYLDEGDYEYTLLSHCIGRLSTYSSIDVEYAGEGDWVGVDDFKSNYADLIMFNGMFHALDKHGRVISIKRVGSENVVTTVAKPIKTGILHKKMRLVAVGKNLLLVGPVDLNLESGASEEEIEEDLAFKVYKLDKKKCQWVKARRLGDYVLFLGDDCAFSAHASKLPCPKGNCIFFSYSSYFHRDGIYDLEDGKIKDSCMLFQSPPQWIGSTS